MGQLRLVLEITVAAVGVVDATAIAHSYPTRAIRIIVPYAAGGAVDCVYLFIREKLQEALRQLVIVVERAVACGNSGADADARSLSDCYTILQNTNCQAISPALYRNRPFDT